MTQALTVRRRSAYAPQKARVRRRRTHRELHWLARAKLGNEAGPRIHWGVGIYDSVTRSYIGVFHTTPECGDHLSSLAGFGAGLEVYRYYYPVADGAWDRLRERAMNPQPWSLFQNCQHSASYILSGQAQSPTLQVATVAIVSAAAMAVVVAASEQQQHPCRRRRG